MRQRRSRVLVATMLVLAMAAPASAQLVKGLDAPGEGLGSASLPSGDALTPFLIEPDAEILGDQIKQQTYRSQAAGQNKNWNLDIGRFQAPINEDPNHLAEDLTDGNFSGMRFRLPFRGGTGN